MPAFTSVTINDGETTPVAHTFAPHSHQGGVGRLAESDGVPVGDNILSVSSRETDTKYKCQVRLQMPVTVTETVNGVSREVVDRNAYADLQLTFDKSATAQERKNIVRLMGNALAGDSFIDAVIVDLEGIW